MIEVKNVCKSFSGKQRVLDDVSFEISEGDVFGIIGHSGAGKSTLLRCFNGLERYDSGSIKVNGRELSEASDKELKEIRRELGMIFQNFSLITRKNVFDNVAFPLEIWGYEKKEIQKRVTELLELVGLTDKATASVKRLSGGEKQRVGIARALALNPKILLCDEATSALDPKNTKAILSLLLDINKKLNITIVIVTHQMEVIREVCRNLIVLDGGVIKAQGPVEQLFLRPTRELEKLMGEEELIPASGINIKLFFPKEISQACLITSIARELDIDFSIVWGKLERFREDVLGSLIINVEEQDAKNITEYLDQKKVMWEVL